MCFPNFDCNKKVKKNFMAKLNAPSLQNNQPTDKFMIF